MKLLSIVTRMYFVPLCMGILFSGCSLVGLDLQEDYNRTPHTLDPHLYKNAWEYLESRSKTDVAAPAADKIFTRMMEAIVYSEIDIEEYKKPGRTYIFLHNDAILRGNNNDAFFRVNFSGNAAATAWTAYPKEFVRNYLKYLIVEGVHNHYTLPAVEKVTVKTLAPAGAFTALPSGITRNTAATLYPFVSNPTSEMVLQILNNSPSNTQDYPIRINDHLNVRTSSLLATNGTIHVVDRYVTTTLPQ